MFCDKSFGFFVNCGGEFLVVIFNLNIIGIKNKYYEYFSVDTIDRFQNEDASKCVDRCCQCFDCWNEPVIFYVLFATCIISRIYSILFPLVLFVDYVLHLKDINKSGWKLMNTLIVTLTVVYILLLISWGISFVKCIKFYMLTFYLLQGSRSTNNSMFSVKKLNIFQEYYDIRCDLKYGNIERIKILHEYVPSDVVNTIWSYMSCLSFAEWLSNMNDAINDESNKPKHHIG